MIGPCGNCERLQALLNAEQDAARATVKQLRSEIDSVNTEAKRVFTKEFKTELSERTQECDRLRAEVAEQHQTMADMSAMFRLQHAQFASLRATVETVLSDLECADLKCWCFTRAAMDRPACECANCKAWAVLHKVTPTTDYPITGNMCPFRDCVLQAGHSGQHEKPKAPP